MQYLPENLRQEFDEQSELEKQMKANKMQQGHNHPNLPYGLVQDHSRQNSTHKEDHQIMHDK